MATNSSKHILLTWIGAPPPIGLSSQPSVDHPTAGTTPYHTYQWSNHLYGYDSQGSLPIPFHSPFTYLPRQISIYLNATATKYKYHHDHCTILYPRCNNVGHAHKCNCSKQTDANCYALLHPNLVEGPFTEKFMYYGCALHPTATRLFPVVVLLFGSTYCCCYQYLFDLSLSSYSQLL